MPKKEVDYRQSPLRDDKLIIHTSVIKDHFMSHESHFNGFNSAIFHDTYHDEFQIKISDAQNTMSDAFILKSQARHTSKVESMKEELSQELHTINFVVNRTFTNDKAIVNEFRLNKTAEMSKNIDSFIGFSKDVHLMVGNYATELALEGLTTEKVDFFLSKINELDKQRRLQVEAIHTRPIHTKDRIQKMNILWKQLWELRDASEIIFANEPEIKALFALPKAPNKQDDNDEEMSDEVIIAE